MLLHVKSWVGVKAGGEKQRSAVSVQRSVGKNSEGRGVEALAQPLRTVEQLKCSYNQQRQQGDRASSEEQTGCLVLFKPFITKMLLLLPQLPLAAYCSFGISCARTPLFSRTCSTCAGGRNTATNLA